MKEYKVYGCEPEAEDTEIQLNKFAKEGWRVVCSYAWNNYFFVLEREKKVCRMFKR
jgi:hypothetical protein